MRIFFSLNFEKQGVSMSLVKCPECKREVSSKAEKCPQCGAPLKMKKTGGCALLSIIFLGVIFVVYVASSMGIDGGSSSPEPTRPAANQGGTEELKWYQGGTLHKATLGEWKVAPYRDRLATSADMVVGTYQVDGIPVPSLDVIRSQAIELEAGISEVAKEPSASGRTVSETAAVLTVLMRQ